MVSEVPLVTVVIPTKDRLPFLKETLNSVQAQSLKAWRAIVVDDGSEEELLAYLESFAATDPRFRFVGREGDLGGPSLCRNQGVRMADTEYVVFLDSDDLLSRGCLERRVSVMQRNLDIDFALFPAMAFKGDIQSASEWFSDWNGSSDLDRMLLADWCMQTTTPIWRKSFLEAIGMFDERLPAWEDWELHIRALAHRPRYLRFAERDYYYRIEQDSEKLSREQYRQTKYMLSAADMFVRTAQMLSEQGLLTAERCRCLTGLHFGQAYLMLKPGGLRQSLELWRSARPAYGLSGWDYLRSWLRLVYCRAKLFKG